MHGLSHIVMIDDSEFDLVFHEILLRSNGFRGRLTVFQSHEEAEAFFKTRCSPSPDLILVDLNLSGINGVDLINQVATHEPGLQQATIIVLSSSSLPEDIQLAMGCCHVHGYCTKPLPVETVLHIHENNLQRGLLRLVAKDMAHTACVPAGGRYGGTDAH